MTSSVPTFYLYGEPHRSAEDSFVHVEALDDRSRPSGWTISPHSHAELAQLFLIETGAGTMRIDADAHHFTAPCVLIVPARRVHGFRWQPQSTGYVLTTAVRYLDELARRDSDILDLFRDGRAISLPSAEADRIGRLMVELMRELGWSARGHRAAVDAATLAMLVTTLRRTEMSSDRDASLGRHGALVARLRERIDQRFRLREPVASHAEALGSSQSSLRTACAKVAGSSPAAMLDQRALLEAKRLLLYSHLSVAEIAYTLGFEDAAYFSRFFARHAGRAPTAFRAQRQNSDDHPVSAG